MKKALNKIKKNELASIYVHIPFCTKKCFYCSFVVSIGQEKSINQYLSSMLKEMKSADIHKLKTLYIGGGTPSVMSVSQIKDFFGRLKDMYDFDESVEVTFESNPESITEEKLICLKESGVNRISLGVQSMSDENLKFLGRGHNAKDVEHAYRLIRQTGFQNVNLDLMHSFQHQTRDEIRQDIEAIGTLQSEHISLYALDIEPNSRFYARKMPALSSREQADNYLFVIDALEGLGFVQYEVSNFSRPGFESRHNLNYWHCGDYYGFGIGAHSHIQGRRYWNGRHLIDYIDKIKVGHPVLECEENLSSPQQWKDALLFGLRMNCGINFDDLKRVYDHRPDEETLKKIEHFIEGGLLEKKGRRLAATRKGRLVLDEMSAQLL